MQFHQFGGGVHQQNVVEIETKRTMKQLKGVVLYVHWHMQPVWKTQYYIYFLFFRFAQSYALLHCGMLGKGVRQINGVYRDLKFAHINIFVRYVWFLHDTVYTCKVDNFDK